MSTLRPRFLRAHMILIMGGWKALKGVLPGPAVCGGAFGVIQFLISNDVGPQLTAILASIAAMLGTGDFVEFLEA